jgi:hypothetical protein
MVRWAGLVAHIENMYRILVRKQEHLEDLDIDGRIIVVFLKQDVYWIHLVQNREVWWVFVNNVMKCQVGI